MTAAQTALWIVGPGHAELRPVDPALPGEDQVRVRALVSGISRGTERLVFHGKVPSGEWDRMRCPFQEGAFPHPVKYGYAMVGRIEAGPVERIGQRVFSLYPHQNVFCLPADAAVPVPDAVTTERAALAAQMETALNATWDARPCAGDRIAVVGGGAIGALTAYLCARLPGTDVTLIDINPKRAQLAAALGLTYATPDDAPTGCDLVFHASGTSAGLNLAFSLAGFEADVIEMSWFGDTPVAVNLGAAFHSQRLSLRASQVGSVAPARRTRWTHHRRLAKALALCADPRLDALVGEETPFAQIPGRLNSILSDPDTLCHLIRYRES
jgi:threonine dehydrogenase-like Zn-dependent dehydrogenase